MTFHMCLTCISDMAKFATPDELVDLACDGKWGGEAI